MCKISEAAYELLEGNVTLPVPIDLIVMRQGIRLLPYDLGESISGLLVIDKGEATIGYNKSEHRVRNRFTIAHELGHFVLHKDKDIFVDKNFKVLFRTPTNASEIRNYETEANEFAACILMPENLVRQEVEKFELDFTDEAAIKMLAKKFDVSAVSMSYRISNLRLF